MKEFLKPKKSKILIFAIFLFIILLYYINREISVSYCPTIANPFCKTHYTLPWEKPCSGTCGEPDLLTSIIIEIFYPLFIVISYIISCLIVWIYNKVKK